MRRTVPVLLVVLMVLLAGCSGQKAAPLQSQPQAQQPSASAPAPQAAKRDFRSTQAAKNFAPLAADKGDKKLDRLAEGARANKEQELNLYTSMNLEDSTPLIDAFGKWMNAQYKIRVEVNLWRASSEKVLQRTVVEAENGRFEVDVIESNSPELEILQREGITLPFWVPSFNDFPDSARHAQNMWHATRYNFFTVGYNTKLVKKEDLPKTYDDLLDPKWKGKMAIDVEDWDWFAGLVKQGPWGSEEKALAYFKKLAQQDLQHRTGHSLIAELVSSGELPIAITIYNHNATRLSGKGAPIQWLPLEPVIARPNGVAVAANAKNPHMAMLFSEFILSKAGQDVLLKQGRVPANPKADTPLNKGFKYVNADPVALIDEAKKWEQLYKDTVQKK